MTRPDPCLETLRDRDDFAAVCIVQWGTEHSHHDLTARAAVAAGLALEGCPDCTAGSGDDDGASGERIACSNCDRVLRGA